MLQLAEKSSLNKWAELLNTLPYLVIKKYLSGS